MLLGICLSVYFTIIITKLDMVPTKYYIIVVGLLVILNILGIIGLFGKKIFSKIKEFTHEKNFFLALIGVIGLAISVNLVELACSAGLPLIFTQILAINTLNPLQYWFYIFLYILFFLIDDIVVFTIAMVSLKMTGISTKYNKYSHLIGGIIMVIIGILLIFKPGILMFNF